MTKATRTVLIEAAAVRGVAFLSGLAVLVIGAGVSFGSDLRMTVEKPHFTCEGRTRHFSDVAYRPGGDDAAPLPCCDGQIGCAQFLSTNTIVRTPHQWRG